MLIQLEAEAFYSAGQGGGKGGKDILLGEGFEEILLLLLSRFQDARSPELSRPAPELSGDLPLPIGDTGLTASEDSADRGQSVPDRKEVFPAERISPEREAGFFMAPVLPAPEVREPLQEPVPEAREKLPDSPERKIPVFPEVREPLDRFREPVPVAGERKDLPRGVEGKGEIGSDRVRSPSVPGGIFSEQRKQKSEEISPEKPPGEQERRSLRDNFQREEPPPPSGKKPAPGNPVQVKDPPAGKPPAGAIRKSAERDPAPPGGEQPLPANPSSFEEPARPEPRTEITGSRILTESGHPRQPEKSSPEEQSFLRRDTASLQSFQAEELPETENLTAERKDLPHPPRQEVRRIDLRFESAHLRFLLQNENLSVEVSLRERIESHLTYMDAQRLYRNLQTLGVNLEVLRINGVELLPRSWKVGRREDRERGNIGEDGNLYPKADRGAPDSADLDLLL